MEIVVLTKTQTVAFFTFLIIKLPTKRHQTNSIQARLSKNSSDKEICNTAKCGYKDALKKSEFNVDFKYIKNQRKKTKNRSRNIIWFNPPFNKEYPQILEKYFFDWSIDIFQSFIDYIKFSAETQWKLVAAVSKICPKYRKDIIVRLYLHRLFNWHYITVEKKNNVP